MPRIIFFPATGTRGQPVQVTRSPVSEIAQPPIFDQRLGGYRQQSRLNLDPWDLQRLIAEANRLGREGVEVVGFGYDRDNQAVILGPRRANQPSQPDDPMPTSPPATARTMAIADLPIATEFLRELYADQPQHAHLEELPSRLSEFSLVAENNKSVVGILIAACRSTRDLAAELGRDAFPNDDSYLEIQDLFVAEAERNQGIGSMLIREALACAKAAGLNHAMVYSGNADYVPTARFYEHRGFKMWHIFMTHDMMP